MPGYDSFLESISILGILCGHESALNCKLLKSYYMPIMFLFDILINRFHFRVLINRRLETIFKHTYRQLLNIQFTTFHSHDIKELLNL